MSSSSPSPVTTGLQQRNPGWHSVVPSPAAPVSCINSAVRLVFSSSSYDHITPLLRQLYWLTASERIQLTLAVFVYKCLHGTAQSHLADEIQCTADFETRRHLGSAFPVSLAVRRAPSAIGSFLFPLPVLGTVCLPQHITSTPSMSVFRGRLKAILFSGSFK